MDFKSQYILISDTPFGDIQIRYYGIIVVVAMMVAATVAARLASRDNNDPDHVWGGLTWGIFPGIIGARLWYIFFPPVSTVAEGFDTIWYFKNFFNTTNGAIAVWTGGLSVFGAVLGGLIGIWLYYGPLHNRIARLFHYLFIPVSALWAFVIWIFVTIWDRLRGKETEAYQLPKFETNFPDEGLGLATWLDYAGVVLPLAQAIGRWANWVNQELYGLPTKLPWGIPIDEAHRVGEYQSGVDYPFTGPDETRFHPLFIYESLWNLIAFFVLLNVYNRSRDKFREGDFFLLYLMQYSFVRFLLEFLRVEVAEIGSTGINSSQAMTGAVFVLAVVMFFMRRGGRNKQVPSQTVAKPNPGA